MVKIFKQLSGWLPCRLITIIETLGLLRCKSVIFTWLCFAKAQPSENKISHSVSDGVRNFVP